MKIHNQLPLYLFFVSLLQSPIYNERGHVAGEFSIVSVGTVGSDYITTGHDLQPVGFM